MRVLLVDTETGGFKKPLTPIEVAGIYVNSIVIKHAGGQHGLTETFTERYKNTQPMEFGAMAVHHILPHDLNGADTWNKEDWHRRHLKGVEYVVGHNVDFDAEALGITDIKLIDTLALSRYWTPDLDSHKLGAMMYYLFGVSADTRQRLKDAHSASADIENTRWVLLELIRRFGPNIHNWDELYAISEEGRIPFRFTFGKYGPKDGKQGMRIKDFVSEARVNREMNGYLAWMRREMKNDKYLMKALDNPR